MAGNVCKLQMWASISIVDVIIMIMIIRIRSIRSPNNFVYQSIYVQPSISISMCIMVWAPVTLRLRSIQKKNTQITCPFELFHLSRDLDITKKLLGTSHEFTFSKDHVFSFQRYRPIWRF
ncbi:hypothetical protein DFH27DRAFT_547404 [Peziza echinospora]|nr:hypothetical protein DFH27DRAFT_547404 [Peziza echinospora]